KVNALELAARDIEVPRLAGSAAEGDGVEIFAKLFDRDVLTDMGVGLEDHALGLHLLEATIETVLFHLEVGDAIAQEAADAVAALVNRDLMTGAAQLLGAGQARGTRAHHRNLLAGQLLRRLRHDPAFLEGAVDDVDLDVLNGDRLLVDAEDAGTLA